MPKVFIPYHHNSIFNEIEKVAEVVPDINQCDTVLLWNDVNFIERAIIKLAHSKKKKTVVMQHGRKGSSRYYPPFNEKIQADKLLVWGDFDLRALVGAGNDSKRIRVVGTTTISGLPDRKTHDGVNVVFCPEHWDTEVEENAKVKKELRKLRYQDKNIKITTKIIESHDPKRYDNPIQSNRDSVDHLRICAEVLAAADIVVGVSESTFELMAQAMDIPVVTMTEWSPKTFGGDPRYFTYRRVTSPATTTTSLANLNETILRELANPDRLKEQRKQVVIDEGGLGLNTLELIKREL